MDWRDCAEDETDERDTLKPALASIPVSRKYMGGVSRSMFYATILPLLQTVNFGARRLVVVSSMDRLIAERASVAAAGAIGLQIEPRANPDSNGTATEHRIASSEPPDPPPEWPGRRP
jgi:hypothetical protein